MKTAIELIAQERQRQIDVKGYHPEHDDGHHDGALLKASMCYVDTAVHQVMNPGFRIPPCYHHKCWPFERESFKPRNPAIRNLVKAAALIVAEIERLQRADPEVSLEA
jgi:hypothetical protein